MAKPNKISIRKTRLLAEKIKKAEATKSLTLEEAIKVSSEWKEKFD